MLILIFFAFIAGIVTVLSPCILPVLPIVLSGSVGGDKRKPLGVVTGFVLSFTFFTLFLSAIVQATGIPADTLRSVSILILVLFGISLLVPAVQKWIEVAFSKLANMGPKQKAPVTSFWGGVIVGVSLGILWTPCVGPILASVISLAITGSVTGSAFFITLAYSLGTAIPMLAITYGGRQLLMKVPWLLQNTAAIQKAFGVLMILTAVGIYFNVDRRFQTYILERFPQYGVGLTALEDNDLVRQQLNSLSGAEPSDDMIGRPMSPASPAIPAPEIIPGGEWFNTEPLTLEQLEKQDKVVLVDFWTYSCINCIRTIPYLKSWHDKYADDGLVILGVHAPEFEFEKSAENVQEAITDFGIEYPVVQDNEFSTWRAYNNRYWPAKYLVDKDGNIRYFHFGEGKYDETEIMIQTLLEETGTTVNETVSNETYENYSQTPELYLGWGRIEYFASPERILTNVVSQYSFPASLALNRFAYQGSWTIGREYAKPEADGRLRLNFEAKEVFLVMRSTDKQAHSVRVLLNGQPVSDENAGSDVRNGLVLVEKDRLYRLLMLPNPGNNTVELIFEEGNVEVFAFTFG